MSSYLDGTPATRIEQDGRFAHMARDLSRDACRIHNTNTKNEQAHYFEDWCTIDVNL